MHAIVKVVVDPLWFGAGGPPMVICSHDRKINLRAEASKAMMKQMHGRYVAFFHCEIEDNGTLHVKRKEATRAEYEAATLETSSSSKKIFGRLIRFSM
jgi:hypothetical protein